MPERLTAPSLPQLVYKLRTSFSLQARQGKSVLSLLALVLYLSAQALANSSAFHHFLHHDADQPSHQCVVKLLAQGQVDVTPVLVSVPRPPMLQGGVTSPTVLVLVAVEYRLLPERAPPALPA